ncbi:MAG: hypothetical protein MRY72_12580, partial [Aquisalinus sp.]|nr:hypothetical protein [Aquisalinus sp.]
MMRFFLLLMGGLVAISFLGGSAIWSILGVANDLTIEGKAAIVRDVPDQAGTGWPAYGGDQGGNRYSDLESITPANVNTLEVAWEYRSGTFEGRE